jgi:hypothetical protein
LVRNDFVAGLANPSELGGLLEFLDDIPNLATSSSIRANATAGAAHNSAFSATNCSYEGRGATSDPDTPRSKLEADRFRRHFYYAARSIPLSNPHSYSTGVR